LANLGLFQRSFDAMLEVLMVKVMTRATFSDVFGTKEGTRVKPHVFREYSLRY
jgi:hypothetical protein